MKDYKLTATESDSEDKLYGEEASQSEPSSPLHIEESKSRHSPVKYASQEDREAVVQKNASKL